MRCKVGGKCRDLGENSVKKFERRKRLQNYRGTMRDRERERGERGRDKKKREQEKDRERRGKKMRK